MRLKLTIAYDGRPYNGWQSQACGNTVQDHILRALKENGFGKARVEGLPHCDWVLIDAGDLVIHIFRPEVRTFYNLERMWAFGDSGSA